MARSTCLPPCPAQPAGHEVGLPESTGRGFTQGAQAGPLLPSGRRGQLAWPPSARWEWGLCGLLWRSSMCPGLALLWFGFFALLLCMV